MTTEATPDGGQTTATAGEPSTPAPAAQPAAPPPRPAPAAAQPAAKDDPYEQYKGEPIRDFADAKRNIDRRIELENENRELREQLKTTKADANAAQELVAEQERVGRRRSITDVILGQAHPEHVDELRLMLPGLHEAKELDLYAEDTKAEGSKALDKLAKRYPKYFRSGELDGHGGTPASSARSYGNPRFFTDLTPEQQAALSKEDFEKMFGRTGDPYGGQGPVVQRRR